MTKGWVVGAVALIAVSSVARQAAAVSPAADAAFQEGRRLLADGKTAEACVKFAESFALDASSGTLINLALCHEKQGRLATAWAEYLDAARSARDQRRPDRANVADVKASLIEPRVPKLTPTTAQLVPGLRVEIDQRTIGEGAPGVAVRIDPGTHQLTASAPGYTQWTTVFDMSEGENRQLEIPALEPKPAVVPSPPSIASGLSLQDAEPAPANAGALVQKDETVRRAGPGMGWVLTGSGLLLLGAGAVFGIVSLYDYRKADGLCPSHQNCSAAAISRRDEAETTAWVSDATLAAGAVAAVIGGYLVWKDRRASKGVAVTPTVGPDWIGVGGLY